jgi:hypothetical protein
MIFDELKTRVEAGNLPETPEVFKFNQGWVLRGNYDLFTQIVGIFGPILGKNVQEINNEILSSSYENMLQIIDREFGTFLKLEPLTNEELAQWS